MLARLPHIRRDARQIIRLRVPAFHEIKGDGRIDGGKIVGGQSHALKAGDVEFIPAGVPHGVSGVQGSITWLNIRWDTDWATKTPADE